MNNDSQASTFYLRSGCNYLRLKTAEVGYTFNKWIRAYVSGANLLTFSPFKHWDPRGWAEERASNTRYSAP